MEIKRIGWKHLTTLSYGGMKFAMSVSIDGEITLVDFEYFKGEVEFFSFDLSEDVAMIALAKSVVIDYVGVEIHEPETCNLNKNDDGVFECDECWSVLIPSSDVASFKYCPFCGLKIKEVICEK